ncbi:hypothetical protein P168DRAFT_284540 [Aspergillus campestris IBT 28561]|uniref:Uncharacterized protein n=1 Tax=Aspergillus campestris (strain IBT 28561) TaxID=1392248 RepID=A0A2I1CTN6_ASPC2|nr:uncharacterized protein P168DRAFT_284540 [Aspergillus campestris IBT 28561]PKY00971.1 hypothetical protein P168DRAFT_284540 [Aspergillus campestris IBT 28561]
MKFPLFLLLVLCSTNTAAYGISGAYERMLYWYAYELDQQADGPKVVAKRCAGEFGVKTCNLKQFLTYIAEGPGEKANARSLPDAINGHSIKADTAAEMIHRGHLTGSYRINYVYEMVDKAPDLFAMIARHGRGVNRPQTSLISDKTAGKSVRHYPLNQVMTARKRIEDMRVAGNIQAAGDHLRQKFDANHVPANDLSGGTPVTQGLVVETSERVSLENNLRYIAVNLQEAGERIQATNPPNAEPEGSGFNLS